jgi:hypothetical protein
MLGLAMIAQVEPDDLEAPLEEMLSERYDVRRVRTAFPAVKKDCHARNIAPAAIWRDRMECEQTHTVATIEDFTPRSGDHFATVAQNERPRPQ